MKYFTPGPHESDQEQAEKALEKLHKAQNRTTAQKTQNATKHHISKHCTIASTRSAAWVKQRFGALSSRPGSRRGAHLVSGRAGPVGGSRPGRGAGLGGRGGGGHRERADGTRLPLCIVSAGRRKVILPRANHGREVGQPAPPPHGRLRGDGGGVSGGSCDRFLPVCPDRGGGSGSAVHGNVRGSYGGERDNIYTPVSHSEPVLQNSNDMCCPLFMV